MYRFPEDINYSNFFRMDRSLVFDKHWAQLPLASKAIYPTIGVHCSSKGKAFPAQETIGIITGCTPKTVREGVKGLVGFPGFEVEYFATRRGHRACRYYIQPLGRQKGNSIWIYRAFFDGGNWSLISNKAKAVYPVILAFSFFEFDIYCELSNDDYSEYEESEYFSRGCYEMREFDISDAEIDVIAEHAGISVKATRDGMKELEHRYFIEKCRSYFKVFRAPPRYYQSEWLNKKCA